MAGKTPRHVLRRFFLCALFLLTPRCFLTAQSGPEVHRLSWQAVEYASRYEVIVEVLTENNRWIEAARKTSEGETFIDCPLFIGTYRFRVSAWDLLGRPGSTTAWAYFEVRPSPESREGSPDNRPPDQSPDNQSPDNRAGPPDHNTVFSYAPREAPEESEKTPFRLELHFSPLIILPFSDFNEIYSSSPVQPLGFSARFAYLPFALDIGTFGLELIPSWNYLANDILHNSRYTHILSGQAAVFWQIRPFGRTTALLFRLGGGMSYVNSRFDFNDGRQMENLAAWNPSAMAGFSFLFFLNKSLYINTGLEYFHVFTLDNPTLNYLRPSLGLGWWF